MKRLKQISRDVKRSRFGSSLSISAVSSVSYYETAKIFETSETAETAETVNVLWAVNISQSMPCTHPGIFKTDQMPSRYDVWAHGSLPWAHCPYKVPFADWGLAQNRSEISAEICRLAQNRSAEIAENSGHQWETCPPLRLSAPQARHFAPKQPEFVKIFDFLRAT